MSWAIKVEQLVRYEVEIDPGSALSLSEVARLAGVELGPGLLAGDNANHLVCPPLGGQRNWKVGPVCVLDIENCDETLLPHHAETTSPAASIFLPGYGFGLGPAIHADRTASNRLSSLSEWRWAGLFHTWYQVDHDEGLISIVLTQLWPDYASDMEARFHTAVHAAVTESPGKPIRFKK